MSMNSELPVRSVHRFKAGELPKYEIMTDYIFGYVTEKGEIYHPTLNELAEKYGCSDSTLKSLCNKESWTPLKTAIKTRLKKTASKQEIAKILSVSGTLDARVLENVEKSHNIASKFLDKLAARMDEVDELEMRDIDKIPNALSKILQVMEKSAHITRSLLGEDARRDTLMEDIERIVEGTIEEFGYIEGVTDIHVLEDEIKKINAQRAKLDVTMDGNISLDALPYQRKPNSGKRKL